MATKVVVAKQQQPGMTRDSHALNGSSFLPSSIIFMFFEFFYKYGENHAMCTMYREL